MVIRMRNGHSLVKKWNRTLAQNMIVSMHTRIRNTDTQRYTQHPHTHASTISLLHFSTCTSRSFVGSSSNSRLQPLFSSFARCTLSGESLRGEDGYISFPLYPTQAHLQIEGKASHFPSLLLVCICTLYIEYPLNTYTDGMSKQHKSISADPPSPFPPSYLFLSPPLSATTFFS